MKVATEKRKPPLNLPVFNVSERRVVCESAPKLNREVSSFHGVFKYKNWAFGAGNRRVSFTGEVSSMQEVSRS